MRRAADPMASTIAASSRPAPRRQVHQRGVALHQGEGVGDPTGRADGGRSGSCRPPASSGSPTVVRLASCESIRRRSSWWAPAWWAPAVVVGGGRRRRRWVGRRWVRQRWVGLRWVGLRWVGLRWVRLRWVGLGWVGRRGDRRPADRDRDRVAGAHRRVVARLDVHHQPVVGPPRRARRSRRPRRRGRRRPGSSAPAPRSSGSGRGRSTTPRCSPRPCPTTRRSSPRPARSRPGRRAGRYGSRVRPPWWRRGALVADTTWKPAVRSAERASSSVRPDTSGTRAVVASGL